MTDRSCRDWYACGDPAGRIGLEERIGLAEVDRSLGADRSSMTDWILYGEDRLCGVDQSSCSVADRFQV